MDSSLEKYINEIEGMKPFHSEALTKMLKADNGKFFGVDFLAVAALKRSISLCSAFSQLVVAGNYQTSAALLRLQLDTCLRFYSVFLVEKPHEFALDVLKGIPIRKMKDRHGERMTDRYLVDSFSEKYEWAPRVYDATSGFIHLSERHIFCTLGEAQGDSVGLIIGDADEHIEVEFWIEMVKAFIACSWVLFEYINGWVFTKEHPDLVARGKKDLQL